MLGCQSAKTLLMRCRACSAWPEKQNTLRTRVAELREAVMEEALEVWAMHRNVNMEVVAEKAHTEHVEYTARVAQLEGDRGELNG